MSYPYRNTLLVLTSMAILLLASFSQVYAKETYFEISFDRSVAITPPEGKKSISSTHPINNIFGKAWHLYEPTVAIEYHAPFASQGNYELTAIHLPRKNFDHGDQSALHIPGLQPDFMFGETDEIGAGIFTDGIKPPITGIGLRVDCQEGGLCG